MSIIENKLRFAISGKANSGKNTIAQLITDIVSSITNDYYLPNYNVVAFADPIKRMVMEMFPNADPECLFGASKLRNEIIPDAFDQEGRPLTYRQALIDIGTLGRKYDPDIWVKTFDAKITKLLHSRVIVAPDLRFRNEFSYLKQNGFIIIRVIRDDNVLIDNPTETEQDKIKDSEFNHILDNNRSLKDLEINVRNIVKEALVK